MRLLAEVLRAERYSVDRMLVGGGHLGSIGSLFELGDAHGTGHVTARGPSCRYLLGPQSLPHRAHIYLFRQPSQWSDRSSTSSLLTMAARKTLPAGSLSLFTPFVTPYPHDGVQPDSAIRPLRPPQNYLYISGPLNPHSRSLVTPCSCTIPFVYCALPTLPWYL